MSGKISAVARPAHALDRDQAAADATFWLATRTKRLTLVEEVGQVEEVADELELERHRLQARRAGVAAPGSAPGAAAPPPTGRPLPAEVEVWVSAGSTPDCSAAAARWSAVCCACVGGLHRGAGSALGGSPPAAAGVAFSPLRSPVGRGWRAVARAVHTLARGDLGKADAGPAAAASSWTITLGMSTCAGMALPSRTICVKSAEKSVFAPLAGSRPGLGAGAALLLLGERAAAAWTASSRLGASRRNQ